MRLELTRVGLLVQLANHYTTNKSIKYDKIYLYLWWWTLHNVVERGIDEPILNIERGCFHFI